SERPLRKASKRLSCHKRYKIQKKVREHHRKVRKEAKKRGHRKPKKDPGIPGAAPFKEQLLREAEQRKQRLEELKQKQKLNRQKEHEKRRKLENPEIRDFTIESVYNYFCKPQLYQSCHLVCHVLLHSCLFLTQVLEASDVVLEVLDARDPMGCRCPQLEQAVTCSGGNKKLLLVLNKIDLVPKDNVEKWLNYLKKEFPTVAFKSVTKRHGRIDFSESSQYFGSKCLSKLLQEYGKTQDKAIQVGVVGFPNVGKSSIINSLKGKRACNVGLTRGVTKSIQAVHLDKQTKMLDSPSIIPDPSNDALALALRSIIDPEGSVPADVLEGVNAIINHCSKQQVMMHYNIPDFRDPEEFLSLLAHKRGMLKRGAVPDIENAAKLVLCDWTGYVCCELSFMLLTFFSLLIQHHRNTESRKVLKKERPLFSLPFSQFTWLKNTPVFSAALKHPSPASSIAFQSAGMTNGIIEENKVIEEESEWQDMEISKEEEEEEFTESDDDEDDMEDDGDDDDVKEVN
uniref:Guanine nucleotide-binding protein-like 3 n=1 Tax=Cyanistes caeruleus TaxID=156563 RepID=A0A8C0VSY6_CYACU